MELTIYVYPRLKFSFNLGIRHFHCDLLKFIMFYHFSMFGMW